MLYSTSTMERHHFDQCLMILSSQVSQLELFLHPVSSMLFIPNIISFFFSFDDAQGCQILSNVSKDEHKAIIKVLEEAIISTDLAVYFKYVYNSISRSLSHSLSRALGSQHMIT